MFNLRELEGLRNSGDWLLKSSESPNFESSELCSMFRPAILYIDDEKANLTIFQKAFASEYLVKTCLSGKEALEIIKNEEFPLVIADQKMPGMTGIELCEKLIEIQPQTIRMILTAYSEPELLLDAINRGRVHDYIVKPWRKSELKPIIEKAFTDYKNRALRLKELEEKARATDHLHKEIKEIFDFESIVGASSGLGNVMETIKKAAPTDSTILILGETGTGKELLARAVHENSQRKEGPFVPIHCAALARTILESELFGHEKGAFTGADQTRIGRFETADGGTLFLDEIAEIPEDVQVKLLRVLQEKEIQRVGGNRTIKVNVRLVAATNKNLNVEVREGRFREDLYYRLNVISLTVPPLRERKEDIAPLASYFLKKFCAQTGKKLSFSDSALTHLGQYDWPGNVRELQNIIERTVILSAGPEIESEDLKLNIDEMLRVENVDLKQISTTTSIKNQIQQKQIQSLADALRKANGNISEAARFLGIARSTLFDRLKKYHMI